VKALLDTNILIDYLLGIDQARKEIKRYSHPKISVITWMEILVGVKAEAEEKIVRSFLEQFELIQFSTSIAELAVAIRRTEKLRIPDAVIWASAKNQECILVTRNSKDFPLDSPEIRIPYKIQKS